MRLEDVSAQLRPRGTWEAVDLGLAMVRRHLRLLLAAWCLTVVPLWGLLLALSHWVPMGWVLLAIWWLKPIYDRVPLFILSRSLFGATPRLGEVLRAWPGMLTRNFFGVMLLRFPWLLVAPRFSWARSLLLPVLDLEQQRGRGFRERQTALLNRAGSTAGGLIAVCGLYESMMVFALLALLGALAADPLGSVDFAKNIMEMADRHQAMPVWLQWSFIGGYLLAMTLVELYYVGAGFGLYLNCRTHLEGWDVEIAFRRLAKRLSAAALVLAGLILILGVGVGTAAASEEPAKEASKDAYPAEKEAIRRVMAQEDFTVQKERRRVYRTREGRDWGSESALLSGVGNVIFYAMVAGVVGWLGWLIYKNRHLFLRGPAPLAQEEVKARTIMGMDVSPDSLPADLIGAARACWQAGDARGALSLLYRGSVGWLVHVAQLRIRESDTEGDCLRHAEKLPDGARVGYFSDLTAAWIAAAYADQPPVRQRMENLLQGWPFAALGERGTR